VILMKPEFKSLINVEAPLGMASEDILKSNAVAPFNDNSINFASLFSRYLLRDSDAKQKPELVALAYWMRKANILNLKDNFHQKTDASLLPRGLAFHIAPSNVDTIFIYSLFLSIFCGNTNVVRLSSTLNPQVELLIKVLNECFDECPEVAKQVLLIRYEHHDDITAYFSENCDLRVIWGGDETIRRIRRFPLPPRAKELTFADRFSISVLNSQAYLESEHKDKLVAAFYNDSYLFNQMACSSPRLVCWVDESEVVSVQAQTDFWQRMESYVIRQRPDISSAALMDKYLSQCVYAIEADGLNAQPSACKFIARMQLSGGSLPNRELHKGNGLFLEMFLGGLAALLSVLDRKDQTMTAFGFSSDELTEFIEENIPRGIDRIVPFGEALEFSSVWDGYDLLLEMTRSVTVKS